jgi:hypothetical protein
MQSLRREAREITNNFGRVEQSGQVKNGGGIGF